MRILDERYYTLVQSNQLPKSIHPTHKLDGSMGSINIKIGNGRRWTPKGELKLCRILRQGAQE